MNKMRRVSATMFFNGRPGLRSRKRAAISQSLVLSAILLLLAIGGLIHAPCHAANNPQQIVVGSETDFPPYAIVDANGRASGFSVELLEAVAEAMGLSVKVSTGPWPEVLASFKSGKYDLLPLVALSPQRAGMATYTKPHTVAYDCFFVRRGGLPISSLAEAKGKEVIVMSSDAAHEKLDASGVQARVIETRTIPEAMRLLASGKHDAVLVPKLLGLIVLREAKLEGVIEAGNPIADYNRQFAFAVQRGNTELRDTLEQGLAIVHATGRYDAIYRKWFGRIEPQKRRLKTIIVDNYPPYTYLNERGEADGFSVEIARAVAKTMDLALEIRTDKWDRSMKELERGGIDLIPMMAYSPERDELFDFSVPYTIAYDTIFFKKGAKGIRSLGDLNGKTVIVTNNDAAHGHLLSSGLSKTMTISLANSLPDLLTQLAAGKGDAAIMPKLVGLVVAKNLNLKEIDVSPEIISEYSRAWCFAVRNGDQAMLDRINQGLNIIKATGEYDAIYKKWFGALEGSKLQWETILKYGSVVVLILFASMLWNVMLNLKVRSKTKYLKAEIAERKRAEEQIATEKRLQQLLLDHFPGVMLLLRKGVREVVASNEAGNNVGAVCGSKCFETWGQNREICPWCLADDLWATGKAQSVVLDTGEKVFEAHWVPVSDDLYLHYALDVTTHKRAEEKVQEKEQTLQQALGISRSFTFEWDPKTDQVRRSESCREIFGADGDEFFDATADRFIQHIHPDDLPQFKRLLDGLAPAADTYKAVFRMVLGDGAVVTLEETAKAYFDAAGKMERVIGVATDVTGKRHAAEALKQSNQKLELTLRAAGAGTWDWDMTTQRLDWSRELFILFGLDPDGDQATFESWDKVMHPEDRAGAYERINHAIKEKIPLYSEYRIVLPEGKIRWINALGDATYEESGQPVRMIGICTDITERKRLEDERKSLEERLQRAEKMEALGQLAGGVAHDLNNVLGIVVGYAGMLLDDVDESSPIRTELTEILSGGERAAAIVQDLLTLARRGVSNRKVLNLSSMAADFQNSPEFQTLSSYHPTVKIGIDLEPNLLNLSGSPVHIGKALFNLVSNGCESMPNGGVLTIGTANQYIDRPIQGYDEVREGDYVVLSVSDTGEGIPADDLKRIFEPFYTKKVMGRSGTGLGLAVVWGTVKDHNGYINVQSEEGRGSTFTLYFPVTRDEITADPAAVPVSEYMGRGESILIVDDVKGQRELAAAMLRKLNYRVSSVASGEEAVAHLQGHPADLLILDMIMDPGMDGLDTYRKLLEISPKQRAIIVSGFSETDRVKEAERLGAGAYVKKPYILEILGLAVRKELDRKW